MLKPIIAGSMFVLATLIPGGSAGPLVSQAAFTTPHLAPLERSEASERQRKAEELATLRAQQAALHARRLELEARIANLKRASRSAAPVVAASREAVLDCIWRNEGSPAYTNGAGIKKTFRGRYQFDQDSWNNVGSKFGRPELVGIDVALASPADQDDMAWRYFQHSRYSPWPPSNHGNCP